MASKLQEAKAEVKAARGRIAKAWNALVGARVTAAAALMFAIAFGMTLVITPGRLPPIGGLSLAQVGLPPLDLGIERQIATDIVGAAEREGARDHLRELLDDYPQAVPWVNWAGFAIALALLFAALRSQIHQIRRGIEPL